MHQRLVLLILIAHLWLLAAGMAGARTGGTAPVFTIPADPLPAPVADGEPRFGPLRVVGLDDRPRLKVELERQAYEARLDIWDQTQVDWQGTALVVWIESNAEFHRRTGHRAEHAMAAANAERQTMYINASAYRRSSPLEQQRTITHEMGHLLVGSLPASKPTRLPLWFEEGLVQQLAGQWTFDEGMAVSRTQSIGRRPRLSDMEMGYPADPSVRSLAYAVSYRAVAIVAEEHGDEPGSVTRLVRRLADPERGPAFNEKLWSRAYRDGLEERVDAALGGRIVNTIILVTSGTVIWLGVMMLAFWAWGLKKKRALAHAEREAEDEPWAASLTDEDVQDVWGDREERWDDGEPEPDYEPTDELPWERWERIRGKDEG